MAIMVIDSAMGHVIPYSVWGGRGEGAVTVYIRTYVPLVSWDQTFFLLALHNCPAKGKV